MLTLLVKYMATTLLFSAIIIFSAAGDVYTWTDENGVKHFANEPPPDIENTKKQVEIKYDAAHYQQWEKERKERRKAILNDESPADSTVTKKTSPKADDIAAPGKVVIFTSPTCGYCIRAKAFFAKYKVAYTEYDITIDPQAKKQFLDLNGNGVPLIFIGKERIIGFNQNRLKKLLGIKG